MMRTLKELLNDLHHMDEVELLVFGRKRRANPDSVEYLEARAEWKRRQQRKAEIPKPQPVGPTSEEFAQMGEGCWRQISVDSVRGRENVTPCRTPSSSAAPFLIVTGASKPRTQVGWTDITRRIRSTAWRCTGADAEAYTVRTLVAS
jgi:hypothetical protein